MQLYGLSDNSSVQRGRQLVCLDRQTRCHPGHVHQGPRCHWLQLEVPSEHTRPSQHPDGGVRVCRPRCGFVKEKAVLVGAVDEKIRLKLCDILCYYVF